MFVKTSVFRLDKQAFKNKSFIFAGGKYKPVNYLFPKMQNKLFQFLLSILFSIVLFSCNKDDVIEQTAQKPEISLDSESGVYTVKAGKDLLLTPIVINDQNASYEWIMDDKVVGNEKSYRFNASAEGEYYLTFKVKTVSGEASIDIRVDVAKLTPPLISFAIPESGINVKANTEYIFQPDVQHAEEASYRWYIDGKSAGNDIRYTFNQSETRQYNLSLAVENQDGTDSVSIKVNVLQSLPIRIFFDKPSLFTQSNDRYVFEDKPIYLTPIIENMENPTFRWFVDGKEDNETSGTFRFRPPHSGTFQVTVKVNSSNNATVTKISRNILCTGNISGEATVRVICGGNEDSKLRPFTTGKKSFDRIYEYVPAPGQFINDTNLAGFPGFVSTLEQANDYAEKRLEENKFVSLGGFGGYIIVGFDHSIQVKNNSEGYDFSIGGNAYDKSSEPGIVWVMQDVNGNHLPDDTWYELKGSEYGKPETNQNYAVTYYRPRKAGMNTAWSDNAGNKGQVDYLENYHKQPTYYPTWVNPEQDSYTLRGTCLKARNKLVGNTWENNNYDWGYADNFGSNRLSDEKNPNADNINLYFRISDAVNPDKTPANLKYFDFIKVQTGVNAKSGWTGELSTEVCSFSDM